MVWGGELKNTAAERRLFQRRAMVMLVFVLVLMTGLLARMYQLQIVEHEIYTTLSDKTGFRYSRYRHPPEAWCTTGITFCWRRIARYSA